MRQKYHLYILALLLLFTTTRCAVDIKPRTGLPLISQAEYMQMWEAIKAETFSSRKLTLAKDLLLGKSKALTIPQIRQIAQELTFEKSMMEYVKFAYDFAYEKSRYEQLIDLFKFDANRDEFRTFVRTKGGQ